MVARAFESDQRDRYGDEQGCCDPRPGGEHWTGDQTFTPQAALQAVSKIG